MNQIEKNKKYFQQVLKEISGKKSKNFSGLGVILYDSKFFSNISCYGLRPSLECPENIFLEQKSTVVDFLSAISQKSHPGHDGYHFFNEEGRLTHISQYLAAPIIKKVIPNELYGTRHLTAQFVSQTKGVIAAGIITHDYSASYFEKGEYHSLDPWNTIYKEKRKGKNYQYYDVTKPHKDIKKLIKIFKKGEVEKILDLGCGNGRNLIYLIKQGFTAYGIDTSEEGIKMAKILLKKDGLKVRLRIGSIFEKLPYGSNFFDAITVIQVIQHGKLKDIKNAIVEIERVLKPKGILFVTLCGRFSKGKLRYCIVKTAKKIAPRTYVPTIGDEIGLTHYIYNKAIVKKHFKNFKMIDFWKDNKDYYCFLGEKRN